MLHYRNLVWQNHHDLWGFSNQHPIPGNHRLFFFLSVYCAYLKTQRSFQTEGVSMVLKQPSVAKKTPKSSEVFSVFPEWHVGVNHRLHTLVIPTQRRKGLCTKLSQIITYQQANTGYFPHTGCHMQTLQECRGCCVSRAKGQAFHVDFSARTVLQRGRFNFLVMGIYRCLMFGHASLSDRHLNMRLGE